MSNGDITDGAKWLGRNKGFVSLVIGFGAVVGTIVMSTMTMVRWADGIVHSFDKRLTVTESRLDAVELIVEQNREQIKAVSDEQLRRTAPVAEIRGITESLKRLEDKIDGN